ncbi:MAG: MarR family transcriptional regulator [Chitinophagales bacterium]
MSQLPNLETTLLPWIGKTAKMLRVFMADHFKKHNFDLTTEQWILLSRLHEKDGQAQNDLALITERNKASLTRLINTMEKKNYVARIPDVDDKRVNKIFLTTKGNKIFEATFETMKGAVEELEMGITVTEVLTVIEVMKKLQKNIKIQYK